MSKPIYAALIRVAHRWRGIRISTLHAARTRFNEVDRQSISLPHDYTPVLPGIKAPVLLKAPG